ncbi:hypothetical protein UCRPA7_2852 [Phaeoacremonium minimum UCRPA7]|uniref:Uncharacterized protein n=1 Tax=Phaeoacremonium minimum (strain UCR-PA7) TaxID=1286976 RepID=R8BQL3_PHAM7|nr:hypothetical protein UCRPA7_2852 [Phaeoacremonium minimum UCRPA7]EOO01668.1 hypothetical protein UCRPA7_2852 [Phaeoacremonium minimum UCRPA7]
MVSFFGLKFGADKKKKEPEGKKAPQEWKKIDQNALGEGQFFGRDIHRKGVVNGSIRSVSRPGTSHSTRGTSPYAMQTHNFAASSMYDLSNLDRGRKGSLGSLKPFASDANLRMRFNNASSTSLAAPPLPMPSYGSGSRPGTPNSTRNKAWVNPLDVHFSRPTTPAMPQTPKSPLGQFEFGVSEKAETSSLFGDSPEKVAEEISARVALDQERARAKAEMEARAKAQAELEAQARRHAEAASPPTSPPMSIPSPPASMKREPGPIIIGPGPAPRFQGPAANDERPPSRGRDRPNGGAPGPRGPGSRPRDPREREPRGPKHHAGPHGLPSPPLSQGTRFSEEKASRPIIQNVRAKRDTLTISGAKRKSLEMEIDEFEKSLVKAQEGRKGSSGSSHYSEGIDDRTLGEPMLPPLAPPPLQEQRKPSPQFVQPQRTQSPMGRAPPVRGPNAPRRPNPDEYGASFRRAESPMGRGPTGRPPRPAPEDGHKAPWAVPQWEGSLDPRVRWAALPKSTLDRERKAPWADQG